ncbi:MAG: hypothetical protein ACRD1X_21695 [Vicinamibacteria bacterium]
MDTLAGSIPTTEVALTTISDIAGISGADVRARGADRDVDDFFRVDFSLALDSITKVKDQSGTIGLILTGTKISGYAQNLKLIPAYERQIASYKAETALHDQLTAGYEATLQVNHQRIQILETLNEAEKERAEIYKTIAEARKEDFFDRFMRKAALPVGLVVGLLVGAAIN